MYVIFEPCMKIQPWNMYIHCYKGEEPQADYQGSYELEVNWAVVSTYETTVPELSISLCTIWDYLEFAQSYNVNVFHKFAWLKEKWNPDQH